MVPPRGKTPPGRTPQQPRADRDVLASLSDRHRRRLQREEAKRASAAPEDLEECSLSSSAEAKNNTSELSGPTKKKAAKYRAKLTTPGMEKSMRGPDPPRTCVDTEAKDADRTEEHEAMEIAMFNKTSPTTPTESMADVVARDESATPTRQRSVPFAVRPRSLGKRKRPTPPSNRSRARELMQEDDEYDDENDADDTSIDHGNGAAIDLEEDTGVSDDGSHGDEQGQYEIPVCVVDGDPNLMRDGARQCTGLNSDVDSDGGDDDEDEWEDDWQLGDLSDEEADPVPVELPDSLCSSVAKNAAGLREMKRSGWEYDPKRFGPDPTYAGLYDGPHGPSQSVLSVAEDPLALFFYFLPPKLWAQIAVESNRYHTQSIPGRARRIRSQQREKGEEPESCGDVRRRLAHVQPIESWEILRLLGLLISRMLAPMRKGIAAHWAVTHLGALPVNQFGKFMSRNRFFHILGSLHFSNNKSPQADTDRAWKIRPVVDVLQRTFARGYKVPPVISFDEATLPSRSRYNPTRQYNKDKPHKWGTKVFVAACADTAYCMRLEVYCGAKSHLRTPVPADNNCGEAAVLRNMKALCPPSPTSPWRLVVTDRFYTSVKLALELLHRRMYITGTIQTRAAGYAMGVKTEKKTETVNGVQELVPRPGTIKLAENNQFPQLTAAMWMDRNPVHMLSSGGSRKLVPVQRRIRGVVQTLQAPGLVRDYHRYMGGVDVHDQLRMQRYSVQLSYKSRKYYKTLFLGLVDMALVNAFIVFRHYKKVNGERPAKHYAFFETLMEQLLAVDAETFESIHAATRAEDRTAVSPAYSTSNGQRTPAQIDEGHELVASSDTADKVPGKKTRRQRSCKVCAIFKTKPRKYSKYYCPECSSAVARKYMCNVVREGRERTCFQIWHLDWSNGNNIPRRLEQEHAIRERGAAKRPGKKRRGRVQTAAGDGVVGGSHREDRSRDNGDEEGHDAEHSGDDGGHDGDEHNGDVDDEGLDSDSLPTEAE